MSDSVIWTAIRDGMDVYQPRRIDPEQRPLAAVLLTLVPYAPDPHVLLTVRTDYVEHHKGEISFPGGAVDPGDHDLQFTALRETHEEVGIEPSHVEVLGALDPTITRSGFHVTPYVGVVERAPYPFIPSPREVAEVLEVPIGHLLDDCNVMIDRVERDGRSIRRRSYRWGDHLIYGATASMLTGFLAIVRARFDALAADGQR